MFLLVWKLTGSYLCGIFSGIIFTFSPYHFSKIYQQFSLFHIYVFPLFVLSVLHLIESRKLKSGVYTALSFCLVLLLDYYYAFFCAVIALTVIIYLLCSKKLVNKFSLVSLIMLSLVTGFILSLPSTFVIIKQMIFGSADIQIMKLVSQRPFENLFSQSARPLSYLLPATVHPIFGKFTQMFIGSGLYGDSYAEHTLYLGWTTLIFAFIAVKRWFGVKKVVFDKPEEASENFYIQLFMILSITAWLFSQPPWWEFGDIHIFMPSYITYKIVPMFRAYCRFGVVLMFSVCVLGGYGLKQVLIKFKTRKIKVMLSFFFSGLVLFEFLNFPPFKVIDLNHPPKVFRWLNQPPQAYLWLREQSGDFVVAEYPLDLDGPNNQYKFNQTKHHKKIINATIPGSRANIISRKIEQLGELDTARVLSWLGVKYIFVHTDWYRDNESMQEAVKIKGIEQNPGLVFVKKFLDIDVYEVKAKPLDPYRKAKE
jgi:hypothetical protein